MGLLEEIKSIEMPATRKMDWYYHGFTYNSKDFKNMVNKGIKSGVARISSNWSINNGPFYISVSKDLNSDPDHSAFDIYNDNYCTFILDNILVVPCLFKGGLGDFCSITPLPLRPKAGWQDEYQVFFRISPKKIVGIQFPLYRMMQKEQQKEALMAARRMIQQLKDLDKDIPVYDYSRRNGENVHIVNKEEYLSLTKKLN